MKEEQDTNIWQEAAWWIVKLIRGRLWLVWLTGKTRNTLIAEIERLWFPARQQFNIKRSVSACVWMTPLKTHTLQLLCQEDIVYSCSASTWTPHICTLYTVCIGVLHILPFSIVELQQRSVHPVFTSAYCLCELCVFLFMYACLCFLVIIIRSLFSHHIWRMLLFSHCGQSC